MWKKKTLFLPPFFEEEFSRLCGKSKLSSCPLFLRRSFRVSRFASTSAAFCVKGGRRRAGAFRPTISTAVAAKAACNFVSRLRGEKPRRRRLDELRPAWVIDKAGGGGAWVGWAGAGGAVRFCAVRCESGTPAARERQVSLLVVVAVRCKG